MIRLSGVSVFQWSSSEQVYPFEKASDGSTIYAKRLSSIINTNPAFALAHNIVGQYTLVKYWGCINHPSNPRILPYVSPASQYSIEFDSSTTTVSIEMGSGWGSTFIGVPIDFYILYTKPAV